MRLNNRKELMELIAGKTLSRREMLALGGSAALAAGLAGLSPKARAAGKFDGKSVVFASWGGAYQDAQKVCYCDPFAQKTGATVVQDGPMDEAKFRAMVESGDSVWDVGDITHEFLFNGIKNNLFEKLDLTKINVARVDERYRNDYGIGDIVWSYNIGYSTKTFKDGTHPKSWAEVFDLDKFPGTRTLPGSSPNATLEVAALADGVPVDKLYEVLGTDEGLDRALKKLSSIKDKLILWDTNSQSQQLFIDGEVTCGMILNGRAYDAAQKGGQIAVDWNQNIQSIDYLVIPRGAKNIETALGLIDEMTVAENQAKLANMIAYSPTNKEAFATIDPKIVPWLATSPENAAKGFVIDGVFWEKNLEKISERWEEWKLS